MPPSTGMTAPVMKLASSDNQEGDHRCDLFGLSLTSDRMGLADFATFAGSWNMGMVIGVAIIPGAIALALTPNAAISIAMLRVRPMTPCLVAT